MDDYLKSFKRALFTVFLLAALGVGGFFLYQEYLREQQKNGLNIHVGKDGINASLNLPTSQSNPISAQRQRAGQQTQPITESAYSTNTSVPNEWQSSKVRNNSQGISCSVMGAKKVNLHANCDMQNCDGGSSTNAGTADDGTQVVMTGFQVASNLPNVRN